MDFIEAVDPVEYAKVAHQAAVIQAVIRVQHIRRSPMRLDPSTCSADYRKAETHWLDGIGHHCHIADNGLFWRWLMVVEVVEQV
jgi:hypothetical protein